jgi:predicted permease
MKAVRRFTHRLLDSFLGQGRKGQLAVELESHIQMQIEDNIRLGMSAQEARRAALLKFGGIEVAKENYRDQRGLPRLDLLMQDVRYAIRQFRRNFGFTTIVVLTLALGIGANTAIFSVINAVMLRFLPVAAPERLVFLNSTFQYSAQSGDGDTSLTDYIFEQLRAQRQVFSDLVAFAPIDSRKVAVRFGAEPEEGLVEMVSGNFFSGLGVQPLLGRVFQFEDEAIHAPLAVLSYSYWKQHTGADSSVVGHAIEIKGIPFTVIGVAARDFIGVEHRRATDIWVPLQYNPNLQPWGQPPDAGLSLYGSAHLWWCLKTIGRLQPGISEQGALARLQPVFQHAALEGSKRNPASETSKLYFTPARGIDGLRSDYHQPLQALMLMVAVVLVIACTNIVMLLIARNTGRQREFCLRMALGGGRARLLRQLFTESLLLVGAGGILGLLFAFWSTRALAAWANLDLSLAPDRTVLLFTASLTVLAGIVFSLAPLRSVIRIPLVLALRTSAASSHPTKRQSRGSQIVVALQTSLCLALLVGAGLLLQTLRNSEGVNLGIHTSGLLVFGISPQNIHSDAEALRFYRELVDRMRVLPGVEAVTLSRQRAGSGWSANSSVLLDGADPKGDGNAQIRWNGVGPDYFHIMGTPVLMGRDFTSADTEDAPKVAIVNQTFAQQYMNGRLAVGHQITRGDNPPCTIVGLVANSKYTGVQEPAMPMAWFPYTQFHGIAAMQMELRTSGKPTALLPEVRRAVHHYAPELPLLQPMTQQEQFDRSISEERLVARLAVFFGLLAALLVATGLYGTLSYHMSRRKAEVGIRMALGAQRRQVLSLVLSRSLVVSLVGIAIGFPIALAGARLLSSMLYGVKPDDVWIFAGAVVGVLLLALAASLAPAHRAASVDPMVALRVE